MKDGSVTRKYDISRTDGKPMDLTRRYFVLSPDTDEHALEAIRAYALSCQFTHPLLARSMNEAYDLDLTDDNGKLVPGP